MHTSTSPTSGPRKTRVHSSLDRQPCHGCHTPSPCASLWNIFPPFPSSLAQIRSGAWPLLFLSLSLSPAIRTSGGRSRSTAADAAPTARSRARRSSLPGRPRVLPPSIRPPRALRQALPNHAATTRAEALPQLPRARRRRRSHPSRRTARGRGGSEPATRSAESSPVPPLRSGEHERVCVDQVPEFSHTAPRPQAASYPLDNSPCRRLGPTPRRTASRHRLLRRPNRDSPPSLHLPQAATVTTFSY